VICKPTVAFKAGLDQRGTAVPWGVLREAQRLRAEARQAVELLQDPLRNARAMVSDLNARIEQFAVASLAGEKAAAAQLVEALTNGAEIPPGDSPDDPGWARGRARRCPAGAGQSRGAGPGRSRSSGSTYPLKNPRFLGTAHA
jgi:hypothetical protein